MNPPREPKEPKEPKEIPEGTVEVDADGNRWFFVRYDGQPANVQNADMAWMTTPDGIERWLIPDRKPEKKLGKKVCDKF
jgi:hypothetical protein